MPKIGEIVFTTPTEFTAQTYELEKAPLLGSFVKTALDQDTIYAVVYDVRTEGLDPSRHAFTLGNPENSLADIYQEQPQLAKLLKTTFRARIIGCNDHISLPAAPVRLHEGVFATDLLEVQPLLNDFNYLKYLLDLSNQIIIKNISHVAAQEEAMLIQAGKTLARLLKDDYGRLEEILREF